MKVTILILIMVMVGIKLCGAKGIMGSVIGAKRWNNNKFTTSWGHFMCKHMKKGHLAKSAAKGMLGASLMSGGMLAYNSINNLNKEDDDLKWISEIMAKGRASISQDEISLITMGCFLRLLVIVGCIWSLSRNN